MCLWPPLGGNCSMKFRVIIKISREAKLILDAGVLNAWNDLSQCKNVFVCKLTISKYSVNKTGAMSSPGHEIQSFFTSYLVLHFPEVWKCGVVRQSKDIVSLSPSYEPFVILYLVLHFSEVWKCGKVWQSKDIVALFPLLRTPCHSLLSPTLPRGVEGWKSPTK